MKRVEKDGQVYLEFTPSEETKAKRFLEAVSGKEHLESMMEALWKVAAKGRRHSVEAWEELRKMADPLLKDHEKGKHMTISYITRRIYIQQEDENHK